jgi:hypothetical protein
VKKVLKEKSSMNKENSCVVPIISVKKRVIKSNNKENSVSTNATKGPKSSPIPATQTAQKGGKPGPAAAGKNDRKLRDMRVLRNKSNR